MPSSLISGAVNLAPMTWLSSRLKAKTCSAGRQGGIGGRGTLAASAQSSADQVSAHNDECVIIDTDETVVRKPVLCLKTPPPPPPPPAADAQSSADQVCPLKMVTKLMTTVRPRPTFVLKKCEIS